MQRVLGDFKYRVKFKSDNSVHQLTQKVSFRPKFGLQTTKNDQKPSWAFEIQIDYKLRL